MSRSRTLLAVAAAFFVGIGSGAAAVAHAAGSGSPAQAAADTCAVIVNDYGGTCTLPTTTTQPTTTTTAPTTTTTAPTTTTSTVPPTTTTQPPPPPQTAASRGRAWYVANTGIPTGQPAQQVLTSLTLTAADSGRTFNNLRVNGQIVATAAGVHDVTFNYTYAWQIVTKSTPGIVCNHCEIDGTSVYRGSGNIPDSVQDVTCRFCNIHSGIRGVQPYHVADVEDSWLHDFVADNIGTHRATIATNGLGTGGSAVVERNWMEAGDWTELSGESSWYGDFASIQDITVDGNVMVDAGSYTFRGTCSNKNFPIATNLHVTNNLFGSVKVSGPPGAQYGYVDPGCWSDSWPGVVWHNNTVMTSYSIAANSTAVKPACSPGGLC